MADTKKLENIIGKAVSFLFLAIALCNLTIIVMTSAIMPVFLLIISTICFIVSFRKKLHTAKSIGIVLIAVLILTCFMFFTSSFSGKMSWQYPFQRWYIESDFFLTSFPMTPKISVQNIFRQ